MLQALRNNMRHIMVIVAVSFILTIVFSWGMGGFKNRRTKVQSGILATINGQKIMYQTFATLVDHEMKMLKERQNKESLTDYESGLTVNVGKVEGGIVVNGVPAYAECLLDMRSIKPDDYAWAKKRILSMAGPGSIRSAYDGVESRVKVTALPDYVPWPENPGTQALADIVIQTGKSLGQEITTFSSGGASDGNLLYDLAPTIDGLGPLGMNTHCSIQDPKTKKEQEFGLKSSFVQRALLSVKLIEVLVR